MGDDDLDLIHVAIIAGMTTDVARFIACDYAADRVLLPPPQDQSFRIQTMTGGWDHRPGIPPGVCRGCHYCGRTILTGRPG
jgi:hypothetical protein